MKLLVISSRKNVIAWIAFFYSQIHCLSGDYQGNAHMFILVLEGLCSEKMRAKFIFFSKNTLTKQKNQTPSKSIIWEQTNKVKFN